MKLLYRLTVKSSLFFFLLICSGLLSSYKQPFVIGKLNHQLGNTLFQVAATCAHAWDNNAVPYFPDFFEKQNENMPINYEHVFFRFLRYKPKEPISCLWTLPTANNFSSCPIPYTPNMMIEGTFQSEKYFAHHRETLLALFAPHPDDLAYIEKKYADILSHPLTVGIQMRWFGCAHDVGWHDFLVQYDYDYFEKAMALFPEDTLFVVSSNNLEYAQHNIPTEGKNVIFLKDEPHYIDLFLLSLCKHNIISNSSFGWWAAWLNQNPDKIVVATQLWIDPKWHYMTPVDDVWPESWIRIDANWKKPSCDLKNFQKN